MATREPGALCDAIDPLVQSVRVWLLPDLKEYKGSTEIEFVFRSTSHVFEINALNIDTSEYKLKVDGVPGSPSAEVEEYTPVHFEADNTVESLKLHFGRTFEAGTRARVSIDFKGTLRGDRCCFISRKLEACESGDESDQDSDKDCPDQNWVIATHFEPTDARRFFPCFDAPRFRTVFRLTVTLPAVRDVVVLSNTRLLRKEENRADQLMVFSFEDTPPMPPYILAFAAGPFSYIEQIHTCRDGRALPVRVYVTAPEKMAKAGYALDVAVKAVTFFEELFRVCLPLAKLDLVQLPLLDPLGMENFGLLTFREHYLLVDGRTSLFRRQRIARLVAHEISHQWFGDLVSLQSWSYVWLKEGGARYFEHVFLDHMFPQWTYWTHFLSTIYDKALRLDADVKATHEIEYVPKDARKITDLFNTLSYDKGACILRMFTSYIGKENSEKGFRKFVASHQLSCASSADFWREMQSCCDVPFDLLDAVRSWLRPGHPIVRVQREEDGSFTLTQRHAPDPGSMETPILLWTIPVAVLWVSRLDGRRREEKYFLQGPQMSIHPPEANMFPKINHNHVGAYRAQYCASIFSEIANVYHTLHYTDRLGLFIDLIALVETFPLSVPQLEGLLSRFGESETDSGVVAFVVHQGARVRAFLKHTPLGLSFSNSYIPAITATVSRLIGSMTIEHPLTLEYTSVLIDQRASTELLAVALSRCSPSDMGPQVQSLVEKVCDWATDLLSSKRHREGVDSDTIYHAISVLLLARPEMEATVLEHSSFMEAARAFGQYSKLGDSHRDFLKRKECKLAKYGYCQGLAANDNDHDHTTEFILECIEGEPFGTETGLVCWFLLNAAKGLHCSPRWAGLAGELALRYPRFADLAGCVVVRSGWGHLESCDG